MRSAKLVLVPFVVLAALIACESDDPCQRYIDYICSCHDGEEGFDCNELEATYGDADSDLQNECAIELSDQEKADRQAGVECEV